MKATRKNGTKKGRGRPPTGQGTPIQVRLQPNDLAALDKWIAGHDQPMTRPEALRAMLMMVLEMGLRAKK